MQTNSSKHYHARRQPAKMLTAGALEMIAARFKALSEPVRLKLIMTLENGEKNVTALVEATGATQANVSRHLQVLTETGVVRRRRAGLNVYYEIADPDIYELCEHVCGSLKKRLEQQAKAFVSQ